MNPLIDRANRWIEDEEPLIKTAIELKEEVENKSDWKITVHSVDGKEVESYVIKGKTEVEAKKETADKIKGKKDLRATFKKSTGEVKESTQTESFIDRANRYLTEDIENSEEEYNQEEELVDEPNEDDAYISDNTRGGYDVSYSGKFLGNFIEYDNAIIAIGDKMKTSNFWPNVWHVNERGSTHLIADFNPEYERALEDIAQVKAENEIDAELERNYENEDLTEDIVDKMKDLRSKLMASDYGEDPLYVSVINAKDYTEYNKKLETLRKIRGNTAVNNFLSFVNKNI